MTKLRLVLLATTALTAAQFATFPSHAQTAPVLMAQAAPPPGKSKEAPPKQPPKAASASSRPARGGTSATGAAPAAAPPPPRPAPPPPAAAPPPPRPAPPPPPRLPPRRRVPRRRLRRRCTPAPDAANSTRAARGRAAEAGSTSCCGSASVTPARTAGSASRSASCRSPASPAPLHLPRNRSRRARLACRRLQPPARAVRDGRPSRLRPLLAQRHRPRPAQLHQQPRRHQRHRLRGATPGAAPPGAAPPPPGRPGGQSGVPGAAPFARRAPPTVTAPIPQAPPPAQALAPIAPGAAPPGPRRIDEFRGERRETEQGGRKVFTEPGRVIVVDPGGQSFIRHNEVDRFRYGARDIRTQQVGAETRTIVVRPDGSQIITVNSRGRPVAAPDPPGSARPRDHHHRQLVSRSARRRRLLCRPAAAGDPHPARPLYRRGRNGVARSDLRNHDGASSRTHRASVIRSTKSATARRSAS